jgi:hypothetical protein
MSHLEVAVAHVVVADEAQAVHPDVYGGERTTLACAAQRGKGGGGAGPVGAVGHLEVAVAHVVVADEAQAVSPDGHCSVLADVAWAVQGGECESRTLKTGLVRSDAEGQPEAIEKSDPQHEKSLSGHHGRPQVRAKPQMIDGNSPKSPFISTPFLKNARRQDEGRTFPSCGPKHPPEAIMPSLPICTATVRETHGAHWGRYVPHLHVQLPTSR